MADMKKRIELDKHVWHPSILPGQVVVVSTIDQHGAPNIAPKSWVSMVTFSGPIIAFGCNVEHTTYKNIVATNNYVINIPNETLIERVWALPHSFGADRIRKSEFTLGRAYEVDAPLLTDCAAHLECTLVKVVNFGGEVMVFGEIVAISINAALQEGDMAKRYFDFRPVFFLEDKTYGVIDGARHVGSVTPVSQDFYLVKVEYTSKISVETEAAYWRDLSNKGVLLMAGISSEAQYSSGAAGEVLYIISADSYQQAETIVDGHPGVAAGATYCIRCWHRQF